MNTPTSTIGARRNFLRGVLGGGWVAVAYWLLRIRASCRLKELGAADQTTFPGTSGRNLISRSSSQRGTVRGGNADSRPIAPGGTLTVFESDRSGLITHVWFTIAASSDNHLKELVLRMYWEGNSKPSVETPVGDFFGLTLGQYFNYESAFLACSPGKSLNSYFALPYRRSARITITNEGTAPVPDFYSNIDYQERDIPETTLYFHAQYRQAAPCVPAPVAEQKFNLDGRNNYVFCEAEGSGHLMGITMGVLANADDWFGEGDEMIFVDDRSKVLINGTGTEDYILGSWDFGGRDGATPFAHHFYGAPFIVNAERTGARYCLYRWHGDNPVTFRSYLRHTIEHGHANNRADNFYSVAYWYQEEVYTQFPPLPPAAERVPRLHIKG